MPCVVANSNASTEGVSVYTGRRTVLVGGEEQSKLEQSFVQQSRSSGGIKTKLEWQSCNQVLTWSRLVLLPLEDGCRRGEIVWRGTLPSFSRSRMLGGLESESEILF